MSWPAALILLVASLWPGVGRAQDVWQAEVKLAAPANSGFIGLAYQDGLEGASIVKAAAQEVKFLAFSDLLRSQPQGTLNSLTVIDKPCVIFQSGQLKDNFSLSLLNPKEGIEGFNSMPRLKATCVPRPHWAAIWSASIAQVGGAPEQPFKHFRNNRLYLSKTDLFTELNRVPPFQPNIVSPPRNADMPISINGTREVSQQEGIHDSIIHPSGSIVTVNVTGYYCLYLEGYYAGDYGGYCGATTSGLLPFPGAAACGDAFPLWTWLWLPEIERWAVCVDRGGGLGPYSVDLWFATNRAMQESGALGVGRTVAWAVAP